jgi:hypothetical protein
MFCFYFLAYIQWCQGQCLKLGVESWFASSFVFLQLLTSSQNHHQINKVCQVLVAHTCNPSYSEGRDEEDHSSRPTKAKNQTLSQKYPT